MKTISKTLLAAVLLAGAAHGAVPPVADNDFLGVARQVMPSFPDELTRAGIREGEVRVVLSVDNLGNLEDALVVSSTHPKFTEVTLNAFRKWRFTPIRQAGAPVAATAMVTVKFETRGAVVTSLTPHELAMILVTPLMKSADEYRLHSLKELDQIPTPIAAPGPAYPRELAQKGVKGEVTVGFYIDETGAVRIPSVNAGENPHLAALAIDALRQWRFEPPRSKGEPVLVQASQVFKFGKERLASDTR